MIYHIKFTVKTQSDLLDPENGQAAPCKGVVASRDEIEAIFAS